jgi:hypothetical protein
VSRYVGAKAPTPKVGEPAGGTIPTGAGTGYVVPLHGKAAVMSEPFAAQDKLKVRPPEEKNRVKTRLDNLGTEPEFVHDLIFRIG